MSQKPRPNFTKFSVRVLHVDVLTVAVDRSFADHNAIRYVLPVLRLTSCLPVIGQAEAAPIGYIRKVTH